MDYLPRRPPRKNKYRDPEKLVAGDYIILILIIVAAVLLLSKALEEEKRHDTHPITTTDRMPGMRQR